jgi:hypothetical protein
MLPKYHVFLGFMFSLFIYFIFDVNIFQASIIFLSSFLIDVDHYLFYIFKKRDINPMRAYTSLVKNRASLIKLSHRKRLEYKKGIYLFHGFEFWTLILLFSLFINWFCFVFIGIMFHMILDFIEIIYVKAPLSSKSSVIYTYRTNKGKKSFF